MRLPTLLLALLASLPLFAADEKKPTEPVAKPAEKTEPPVKKKKKGLEQCGLGRKMKSAKRIWH